jgi:hypothetical protein
MGNENSEPTTSVDRVVHTPGPWRPGRADKSYDSGIPDNAFAVFAEPHHRQECGLQGNAAVICVIAKPERMTVEDIANARLIAAAPEMFQVVQALATAEWIEESEMRFLVNECREIMRKVV